MAFDPNLADKYPFSQVKPGLDLNFVEPVSSLTVSETNLTADKAYLSLVRVDAPLTINAISIFVGSNNTGTVDVGIYRDGSSLKRAASSGATALGSTNTIQTISLGSDLVLAPGSVYYLAVAVSSAAAAIGAVTLAGSALGGLLDRFQEKSSSRPLPATIASPADSTTAIWTMARAV